MAPSGLSKAPSSLEGTSSLSVIAFSLSAATYLNMTIKPAFKTGQEGEGRSQGVEEGTQSTPSHTQLCRSAVIKLHQLDGGGGVKQGCQ